MNQHEKKKLESINDEDLARGLSEPAKLNLDEGKPETLSAGAMGRINDEDLARGLSEPAKLNLDQR